MKQRSLSTASGTTNLTTTNKQIFEFNVRFPWCYGPEFVAVDLRKWLCCDWGQDTLYRTRISLEDGYLESFNSKLRYEFLNGEIFYSIKKRRVLVERWRAHFNTLRPHSSLAYRPSAPEASLANEKGHGEAENAPCIPLPHAPDDGAI